MFSSITITCVSFRQAAVINTCIQRQTEGCDPTTLSNLDKVITEMESKLSARYLDADVCGLSLLTPYDKDAQKPDNCSNTYFMRLSDEFLLQKTPKDNILCDILTEVFACYKGAVESMPTVLRKAMGVIGYGVDGGLSVICSGCKCMFHGKILIYI